MRPLDVFLQQKIVEANDPEGFRSLVMEAFGVRSEARDFIKAKCPDFSINPMPGYGGGWFAPATLDGVGKVQLAAWQAEACLHECSHVWWHWKRQLGSQHEKESLAFQVALYSQLDSGLVERMGICPAAVVDFMKGYYFGIGTWAGMYALNGPRTDLGLIVNGKWAGSGLDMGNIIDWEIYAGLCSYTMGQYKSGPRRLPQTMWWIFDEEFTGEVQATPSYEGGVP